MKRVLLLTLAAALVVPIAANPSSAKERKKTSTTWAEDVNRSLFSGSESRLAELGFLRADCTSTIPDVRIVKPPSHGAIRFEQAKFVVTANKTPLQRRCNGKPTEAIRLFYKADAAFTGEDRFVLNVDTKLGSVKRYTYIVDVTPGADAAPNSKTPVRQAIAVPAINEMALNRDVFTGNDARIAAMHYVNTDCSSGPLPDLRIVTAPHNGEYRLETITYAVDRKPDDPRANCNGKPVDAIGVFYKSKADFTGEDNLVVDVDFKSGTVRRFSYKIMVR